MSTREPERGVWPAAERVRESLKRPAAHWAGVACLSEEMVQPGIQAKRGTSREVRGERPGGLATLRADWQRVSATRETEENRSRWRTARAGLHACPMSAHLQ
jgi:hypothetical protein